MTEMSCIVSDDLPTPDRGSTVLRGEGESDLRDAACKERDVSINWSASDLIVDFLKANSLRAGTNFALGGVPRDPSRCGFAQGHRMGAVLGICSSRNLKIRRLNFEASPGDTCRSTTRQPPRRQARCVELQPAGGNCRLQMGVLGYMSYFEGQSSCKEGKA